MGSMLRLAVNSLTAILLIAAVVVTGSSCSDDYSPVSSADDVTAESAGLDLSGASPVNVHIRNCQPVDDLGRFREVVNVNVGDVVVWQNSGEYTVGLSFPTELFGVGDVRIPSGRSVSLTVTPRARGNEYPYQISCGNELAGISKTSAGAPKVATGGGP